VFLLLTGSSGAGKSTTRRLIAAELSPDTECVELGHVVSFPPVPTIAWRQESTEAVVQRALALQAEGRHLLLAGDPVAAGEVVAAPSAEGLEAIAVCLLDVSPEVQTARLAQRGDDPRTFADHLAFAAWMRRHARDPGHMPHVLSTGGWEAMRWDRLANLDPSSGGWAVHVVDTSERSTEQVACEVLTWCRAALNGQAPVMHAGCVTTATPARRPAPAAPRRPRRGRRARCEG
jgi:energy-coupling factor transporter ATP-binding protein EcfA2